MLFVLVLFGMYIDKYVLQLLFFFVVFYFGIVLVLLWYFCVCWIVLIGGFFVQFGGCKNDDGYLMWVLIIGMILIGIVGLLLEKCIECVFYDLWIVVIVLIVNGVLLWFGDCIQCSCVY